MDETVKKWWNDLTQSEQNRVKYKYHEYFKFQVVKDLTQFEIRIAFVLINKNEIKI